MPGIARSLASAYKGPDGTQNAGGVRTGKYVENYSLNPIITKHVLADEGSYFIATNPTPGTALAFGVNASHDVTKNLFVFKNTDSANGKRMYLDYIKILPTVAPASGTSLQFAVYTDTVNRYTSGGTLITAVNVNADDGTTPVGGVYAASGGTVITSPTTGSSARLVARGVARSVIPAVLEEIVIQFGGLADVASSSGTTVGRSGSNAAPVVIGGQQWAVVEVYFPSNALTGLSYEFETAWFER